MRIKLTPSYHWTSRGAIYSKSIALPCLDLHCLVVHCLALHCHALRRPSHTKPCHATPCHTLLCLVLPCLLLTRSPNDHSVQRWHRKLHNRPRGPSAPSPPTLALETSKMHKNRILGGQECPIIQIWPWRRQNQSLEAQMLHQLQIWSWRPPKCFKIDPWRPKCSLPQNLALETSKIV